MPAKPNSRNWNDVQLAIATVAVVTTLGLWNLFAQPSKTLSAKTEDSVTPPAIPPVAVGPTAIPQVKILFTQTVPQTFVDTQQQTTKKKNNNNTGGGGTVTQTRTS